MQTQAHRKHSWLVFISQISYGWQGPIHLSPPCSCARPHMSRKLGLGARGSPDPGTPNGTQVSQPHTHTGLYCETSNENATLEYGLLPRVCFNFSDWNVGLRAQSVCPDPSQVHNYHNFQVNKKWHHLVCHSEEPLALKICI